MAEWWRLITAKIIVTSRYLRNSPKRSATNLVKYMGTREGVEKVAEGIDNSPATVRQQRLVQDIIKFDSAAKGYGEYQDFEISPTKSNATEFIDAFIERNAERAVLAMKIMEAEPTQHYDAGSAIRSVVSALCKIVSRSYDKRIARLNTQIDSKLRSKIEQKKAAHGLKIERGVQQDMDDDESYGMRM